MASYKNNFLKILAILAVLIIVDYPVFAQYVKANGSEPSIRAILYHKDNPRALVYFNGQRFHCTEKMRLNDEWYIDEIRRESILFKKTSTHTFAEIKLNAPQRARFHRDWSFYGHPIALWEATELLAHGFGYQALMHFQAGGTVVPGTHGRSVDEILAKILPPHHRIAFNGPTLLVLPVHPAGESWSEVIDRMKKSVPERLTFRFPGLNKTGIIISRGDDIQLILRKISLGGKVPLHFPKDLHFPVYSTYRNIPFAKMLSQIVYLNQCIIIERENALEIMPWPRQILQRRPFPDYPLIKMGPVETQSTFGPQPPPMIEEHLYNHPIVQQTPTY